MQRAIPCAFLILLAGCQLRPDHKHVLIIRAKSEGGDYFAKYPGPYAPRENIKQPINDAIHKRMPLEEVVAYARTKIPHSLDARFKAYGAEEVVKVGDAYFVEVAVGDLETLDANDCAYEFDVLVSADGIPVEIEEVPVETCPM